MKITSLNECHKELGAKMVDFGGWEMPIQYSSLSNEHEHTRTKAGLFDVSHMGEITVEGSKAQSFLNRLLTNDVSKLAIGQAHYTIMCTHDGGIVDDLLVYKRAEDKYLLCVNASNTEKDFKWIQEQNEEGVSLENVSDDVCQIAIQGPSAQKILAKLISIDLAAIKYYHFVESEFLGKECIISRTGYTGEDGFEIYGPKDHSVKIWKSLLEAGKDEEITPCGLGARDTLRMEAKMALYGHELSMHINPIEAGLSWVVKLDKGEFIGRSALASVKETGPARKIQGLEMLERGIPRQDYEIYSSDGKEKLGIITSGTMSPTLKKAIGIGFVASGYKIGDQVSLKIRDKFVKAVIIKTPFYKR